MVRAIVPRAGSVVNMFLAEFSVWFTDKITKNSCWLLYFFLDDFNRICQTLIQSLFAKDVTVTQQYNPYTKFVFPHRTYLHFYLMITYIEFMLINWIEINLFIRFLSYEILILQLSSSVQELVRDFIHQ